MEMEMSKLEGSANNQQPVTSATIAVIQPDATESASVEEQDVSACEEAEDFICRLMEDEPIVPPNSTACSSCMYYDCQCSSVKRPIDDVTRVAKDRTSLQHKAKDKLERLAKHRRMQILSKVKSFVLFLLDLLSDAVLLVRYASSSNSKVSVYFFGAACSYVSLSILFNFIWINIIAARTHHDRRIFHWLKYVRMVPGIGLVIEAVVVIVCLSVNLFLPPTRQLPLPILADLEAAVSFAELCFETLPQTIMQVYLCAIGNVSSFDAIFLFKILKTLYSMYAIPSEVSKCRHIFAGSVLPKFLKSKGNTENATLKVDATDPPEVHFVVSSYSCLFIVARMLTTVVCATVSANFLASMIGHHFILLALPSLVTYLWLKMKSLFTLRQFGVDMRSFSRRMRNLVAISVEWFLTKLPTAVLQFFTPVFDLERITLWQPATILRAVMYCVESALLFYLCFFHDYPKNLADWVSTRFGPLVFASRLNNQTLYDRYVGESVSATYAELEWNSTSWIKVAYLRSFVIPVKHNYCRCLSKCSDFIGTLVATNVTQNSKEIRCDSFCTFQNSAVMLQLGANFLALTLFVVYVIRLDRFCYLHRLFGKTFWCDLMFSRPSTKIVHIACVERNAERDDPSEFLCCK